jgi:hypothetical protein
MLCFPVLAVLAADHDIIAAFRMHRRRKDKAGQKCGERSRGQFNQKLAIRQRHANLRATCEYGFRFFQRYKRSQYFASKNGLSSYHTAHPAIFLPD